jgi:hypothetical protein
MREPNFGRVTSLPERLQDLHVRQLDDARRLQQHDRRVRRRLHDRPVREGFIARKKRKPVVAEMKARQAAKIRELGHALVDGGFMTLDEQSKALGLARSTTWTSGLSAAIIKRMLLSPQLPPLARRKILEYATDKLAGVYGGSRPQRLKFFERMKRATPENNVRPA